MQQGRIASELIVLCHLPRYIYAFYIQCLLYKYTIYYMNIENMYNVYVNISEYIFLTVTVSNTRASKQCKSYIHIVHLLDCLGDEHTSPCPCDPCDSIGDLSARLRAWLQGCAEDVTPGVSRTFGSERFQTLATNPCLLMSRIFWMQPGVATRRTEAEPIPATRQTRFLGILHRIQPIMLPQHFFNARLGAVRCVGCSCHSARFRV